MKKWIAWSLAMLLLITVFQVSAFAVQGTKATQQNGLSIEQKNIPNGEYVIFIKDGDEWKEKGALSFSKDQSLQKLDLSGSLAGKGPIAVKVAQRGGGAGNIDSILLGGKPPASVDGDTGLVLKKLSETDFDVTGVGEQGIELEFANTGANGELSLTARIESKEISKIPFQFPTANNYKTIDADSAFYKYTLGSSTGSIKIDGEVDNTVTGTTPFFKEYCVPGTGHPNGFIYCWVMNDDENLYVTMDVTPDNTYDGDEDYTKVYARTATGVKEFYLSVPENKWGLAGFTYTDKVEYQHKVYEFKIPLAEISQDKPVPESQLELAFAAYGTMALSGLRVEPPSMTIHVGEEVEIFAKYYDQSYYGDDVTSDCTFHTNNEIATIRREGGRAFVRGVSPGTAQITATSGEMTATPAELTVIEEEQQPLLAFKPDNYKVNVKRTVKTVLKLYNYNDYREINLPGEYATWLSYESSDGSIATVDDKGVVTGISPGTVTITAYFNEPEEAYATTDEGTTLPTSTFLTAAATVTVKAPSSSSPSPAPIPIGETGIDSKIIKTYYRGDITSSNGIYTFDAKEKSDLATLWISSSYFKEMKDLYPDGTIQFNWLDASYSLPLKCIDIESVLLDRYYSRVFIKIEKVKDAGVISAAQGALPKPGANMTSGLYDFSVYIDGYGQKIKDIKNYNCYVNRSLIGIGSFDAIDTTVMKFLPDLGKFTFSPSVFETVGDRNDTTAKYRGNGIFTVVKNPCTFDDIAGHWAKQYIEKLASRMIVSAKRDNLFKPDEKVTRAEFAVMLARGLGITEEKGTGEFGDISSQWYAEEVKSAAGAGLISGSDGKFSPEDNILRGDMAVMISNALEFTGTKAVETDMEGVLAKFKDAGKISDSVKKYVAVCAHAGIIVGRSNGNFDPDDNTTRAEAAAIVEHMLKFLNFMN